MNIFILILLLITGCSNMNESGFDAEIWQSQKGSFKPDNPRGDMIEGLEKYYLKTGMERAKIHNILGEPDTINGQTDIYDIGVSPFGIDLETYQINYSNDKAVKFYVSRS